MAEGYSGCNEFIIFAQGELDSNCSKIACRFKYDATVYIPLSLLFLSIVAPVAVASPRLVPGMTFFATTECLREISVSLIVAVP